MRRVLAGDIGGTNSRLAVCEVDGGRVERVVETVFASAEHTSLHEIVHAFVAAHPMEVDVSCFGIPGPIRGRRATTTNLPWEVDADVLERSLEIGAVHLLNDLEASAHGLSALPPEAFHVVREGVDDPRGNAGLIAAGTGLGQAGLVRVSGRLVPFPTEGGHTDFGPQTEVEIEMLRWLQQRHGAHVSWERVVSGPGLVNIYQFLRERDPRAEPSWLAEEMAEADAASVVTRHALQQENALCHRALELFLGLYGAEAGNLALKILATGGMYIGGGIAPRLVSAIAESPFVERFDAKGRLRAVNEQIPIRIVLDDKAGLIGAATYAASRPRQRG